MTALPGIVWFGAKPSHRATGGSTVSVRPGHLRLSSRAAAEFIANAGRSNPYTLIGYDAARRLLVLQPANRSTPGARRVATDGQSGQIACKAAIESFGLPLGGPHAAHWDARTHAMVVELGEAGDDGNNENGKELK
ncbi:MAG: hypothetical protein PHU85_00690 [Phycisphaerae bacterium]|nr:hypothetical protein [Phycisphaerae bacterium]